MIDCWDVFAVDELLYCGNDGEKERQEKIFRNFGFRRDGEIFLIRIYFNYFIHLKLIVFYIKWNQRRDEKIMYRNLILRIS